MPVHEVRYKAWEGEILPGFRRFLAVPKFSFMSISNKWLWSATLGIGSLMLMVLTVFLVLLTNPAVAALFNYKAESQVILPEYLFYLFVRAQFWICLIPLLIAGPKMIAPELQHRALPIIYSRPITRLQYILGKLLCIGGLLSLMTWVQMLILYILMCFSYDAESVFYKEFFQKYLLMAAQIFVIGMLLSLSLGMVALGASAATKNRAFAAMIFMVLIFGSTAASKIVRQIISKEIPEFSISGALGVVNDIWFYTVAPEGGSLTMSFFVLAIWTLIPLAFMWWRLRPVDIYAE